MGSVDGKDVWKKNKIVHISYFSDLHEISNLEKIILYLKMKKVITYGTYDLLHQGHINLLKRAKSLGDFLIVGVTNDSFDRERGKLNVRNNVLERVDAVRATGLADQIIIEDYVGQKSMTFNDTMSIFLQSVLTGTVNLTI